MVVSKEDVELFFKLMWSLQVFVNTKLDLIPDCDSVEALKELEMERRVELRNAVYANPELIPQFVEENPQGFSDKELSIVRGWSRFVSGDFFIERYLAKHAIFIKDKTVYAVLGRATRSISLRRASICRSTLRRCCSPSKGRSYTTESCIHIGYTSAAASGVT